MEADRGMTVAEIKRNLPQIQDAVIEELREGPRDPSELVDRVSRKLEVFQQMVRYAILSLDTDIAEDQAGQLFLVRE